MKPKTAAVVEPTEIADVCLIVEGAYPYITGGVAAWVHQLVCGLPEVKFALIVLLPDRTFPRVDRYAVPANVILRKDIFLFGELPPEKRREASGELMAALEELHTPDVRDRCPFVHRIADLLAAGKQTSYSLQKARSSWRFLTAMYETRDRQISFLDYFWSWRAIHGPMFRLFDVDLPLAKVYHPLSTGYAGFLGGLARHKLSCGLVLTEHGIYTRERQIEIAQAQWIFTESKEGSSFAPHEPFFKRWWREQYKFLGRFAYDQADQVVALNDINRGYQVAAGADDARMLLIPNGVEAAKYVKFRVERDWSERPFRVGLIGRVVPIKDIMTFIRAIQAAQLEYANLEAVILGPTDEDLDYFRECVDLVTMLGLGNIVRFTGRANVLEWMPQLDVNVLTSLSESQPLVIMEAWAAGLPAIATDVGACREMIEGRLGEDALLGPAGLITPVATPEATAEAIVTLARDPKRWAAMSRAGIARVERFYRLEDVFAGYRALYAAVGAKGEARAAATPRQNVSA